MRDEKGFYCNYELDPGHQGICVSIDDEDPENSGVLSQCQYPCTCSSQIARGCNGVRAIKDGCDCCYMCSRQEGEKCNLKDLCDERQGLYCDFTPGNRQGGFCRMNDD